MSSFSLVFLKKGFPVAFHASTHQNIIEISTLALDKGKIWEKKQHYNEVHQCCRDVLAYMSHPPDVTSVTSS